MLSLGRICIIGAFIVIVAGGLAGNLLAQTSFTEFAVGAGVSGDGGHYLGASFGDINNDGDLDLFAANRRAMGANDLDNLYKNNGDGTFEDFTTGSGIFADGSIFGDTEMDENIALIEDTTINVSGIWSLYMTSDGKAEDGPDCIYITQSGSSIWFSIWQREYSVWTYGRITGSSIELSGNSQYYGEPIFFDASATTDGETMNGTYNYTEAYTETGSWRAIRSDCKKAKGWVRVADRTHIFTDDYALDFYIWDLIPEGITFTSGTVIGPNIGTVDLHSGGPTEYHPWQVSSSVGQTKPTTNDVYTFNVNYSDGTSETVNASVRETFADVPTSLSPEDGEVINSLTPTFSWQPPSCGCQGYYRIWIVDDQGNDVWSTYPAGDTSSVTYNFDQQGTPLQPKKNYELRLIVFDKAIAGGPDNNVWLLNKFNTGIPIPSNDIVIRVFSPVDVVIADPSGRTISKGDTSAIPGATYAEEDLDGDGEPDDRVTIPESVFGSYSIQVVGEAGAAPTDTYTLDVLYGTESIRLAENVQVQNIPAEPYTYTNRRIFLRAGWNLFSIPIELANTSLDYVLWSIDGLYNSVWAYNPASGWERYVVGGLPFLNTLTDVVPSKGYWIDMSEAADLILNGAPVEDAIPLTESWNLVGFNHLTEMALMDGLASIDGYCNSVWGYDPVSGWERHVVDGLPYLNNMEKFKPGRGYWIDAKSGCPPWDVNGVVVAAPSSLPITTETRQPGTSVSRPELPYTIWGNVEANGVKMADGATIFLKVDGKIQASYRLGAREGYGDLYVLDIPANVISPEARLRVQVGDEVMEADLLPAGNPGQIIHLDLSVDMTPKLSMLHQNYPNPFNPETWIPYQLKEDAHVEIRIYTATGRLARTLNLGHKPAGFYAGKERAAHWDGRNEAGEQTASGVYFYSIKAGDLTFTRKMVVRR